jgi:hypothetical protein
MAISDPLTASVAWGRSGAWLWRSRREAMLAALPCHMITRQVLSNLPSLPAGPRPATQTSTPPTNAGSSVAGNGAAAAVPLGGGAAGPTPGNGLTNGTGGLSASGFLPGSRQLTERPSWREPALINTQTGSVLRWVSACMPRPCHVCVRALLAPRAVQSRIATSSLCMDMHRSGSTEMKTLMATAERDACSEW